MSEMLGNQYFMARKFAASVPEFEEALAKTRDTKMIRKKLIICYTQVGQIQRAFQLFHSLIKEDIEFIANTDVIADDCPCPELVTNLSQQEAAPENSIDEYLKLGILWLYCDSDKSLEHFVRAKANKHGNELINSTIKIISAYLSDKHRSEISN